MMRMSSWLFWVGSPTEFLFGNPGLKFEVIIGKGCNVFLPGLQPSLIRVCVVYAMQEKLLTAVNI